MFLFLLLYVVEYLKLTNSVLYKNGEFEVIIIINSPILKLIFCVTIFVIKNIVPRFCQDASYSFIVILL